MRPLGVILARHWPCLFAAQGEYECALVCSSDCHRLPITGQASHRTPRQVHAGARQCVPGKPHAGWGKVACSSQSAAHNEAAPPGRWDARRRAAALFEGEHDFTQFAALTPGAVRDPVKRMSRCAVAPEAGGALRVEVVGDAFLWKMVRHMVRAPP